MDFEDGYVIDRPRKVIIYLSSNIQSVSKGWFVI